MTWGELKRLVDGFLSGHDLGDDTNIFFVDIHLPDAHRVGVGLEEGLGLMVSE